MHTVSNTKKENTNLILFTLGQLISVFGSSVYTFAIGLFVLRMTGSGLSFALTLGFSLVATIVFNPIAGVLADKWDRKRLVVGMDISNGLLFLCLYFLSIHIGLNLILIYSSAFLTTVFTTIFSISLETSKPNLVSQAKLLQINALSKVINSLSAISGPIIGGMVYAFIDMKLFILINGISFMISGFSEAFIEFKFQKEEDNLPKYNGQAIRTVDSNIKTNAIKKSLSTLINDLQEGIRYMFEERAILALCTLLVVLNFAISFSITVPLPFIINTTLKLSATLFGLIEAGFPLGMIMGAVLVKKVMEKIDYLKLLLLMCLGLSICMIAISLPLIVALQWEGIWIYYSAIMIVFGFFISLIDIPILYLLQIIIPDKIRGRVLSMSMSLVKVISPIALILSGAIINHVPPFSLPIVGGLLLLLFSLLSLRSKSLKGLVLDPHSTREVLT